MESEQWEYLIAMLYADAEEQRDFLQQTYPGPYFPRQAQQALIPLLNDYGNHGWELVSLELVILGGNGDIWVSGNDFAYRWTRRYLCAFKRRKPMSAG